MATLRTVGTPGDDPTGLTWDGRGLWHCDTDNDLIYQVDPTTGTVIKSFASPAADPMDLAWDGARLWVVCDGSNQVYQVDPNTGTAIQWQDTPGDDPSGLTFDGRTLWIADRVTGDISQMTGGQLPNPPGGMPSLNDAICFWNLDELAGVRVDAVGTGCGGVGCDLTDNNTVLWAAGVSAQTVNSAQFVAANLEYLNHVDAASLSAGDIDFTFALWVYLDVKGVDRTSVGKYNTLTNQREYMIRYGQAADRFEFYVSNNGIAFQSVPANSLGSPSTGTWYFIAAWHDSVGNTINIQIDNGAIDSLAYGLGVLDGTSNFNLGAMTNAGANPMDGRVDAAGLWKRLLTPAERTLLYNGGNGRQYPF